MTIWISNRQRKIRLSLETIRIKAGKILDALGWAEAELSLTLLSDRAMAALNRRTFGRRGPTNVIAFPVDAAAEDGGQGPAVSYPSSAPPADSRNFPDLKGEAEGLISPSLPLRPSSGSPPVILGEVVISPETTRRQAQEWGWPFEELFDFFLIHGILHLLGYDHDTPEGEAAMEAKSWELLEGLEGGDG